MHAHSKSEQLVNGCRQQINVKRWKSSHQKSLKELKKNSIKGKNPAFRPEKRFKEKRPSQESSKGRDRYENNFRQVAGCPQDVISYSRQDVNLSD